MTFADVFPWLLATAALTVALVLALRRKPASEGFEAERGQLRERIGELESLLKEERTKKDELTGKGKQLYDSFKNLEADQKALTRERDGLQERLAKLEAEQGRREREHRDALEKLSAAKQSLEDEKHRVRREDEERQRQMLEDRDRLWNEHEQKVIARLKDLCSQPEYGFRVFENTNLPEGFDGSFKPDCMIEFLGQYVIFDAKVSRSDNFQNYVTTQVKSAVKKAKGRKDIYPVIFLVEPLEAVALLKETTYREQEFTVHVVSVEALPPLLASLKRITTYEFAEQLNPEERENIIYLLAKMDHHIHARNTFDVLLAKMGAEVLRDVERLAPELAKDVLEEKQKIRVPNFKPSEVKKLLGSAVAREEEMEHLTSPKAAISRKEVEAAERMLVEM